jgi:hypothetical protein
MKSTKERFANLLYFGNCLINSVADPDRVGSESGRLGPDTDPGLTNDIISTSFV